MKVVDLGRRLTDHGLQAVNSPRLICSTRIKLPFFEMKKGFFSSGVIVGEQH
jgi:hypothetical protein